MSLPLIALFLAAFAFGTAEFVIAGVLPEVADGLGVSVPLAGYLVTAYAIGIAIGGPLLAIATKRVPRKPLIILLSMTFVLGHALCALAPGFEVLLAARILVSVVHGTYFGIAAIVAVGMVPPDRRGFAAAVVLAGLTVSNILGVPAGTAIGNMFGWRATFWGVGIFGVIATIAIALFLPAKIDVAASKGSLWSEFKALARQQVITSLLIVLLVMVGQYSLFTYIAPFLLEITRLDPAMVPWILLIYGIGSTAGVFIGGRLADWRLMPSLVGILSLQAMFFVLIYVIGPNPILMGGVVLVWGGLNFAFGSPIQARVLAAAGDAPNLASALIPSGYNIGIAMGAILGAAFLEAGLGYRSLPLIGSASVALATLIAVYSYLQERRGAEKPALAGADSPI
jgi:DHA1 family inner membrane transport protein